MPNPTPRQVRQTGIFIYELVRRSESSVVTLSSGAVIGITIAGSVLLFLVIVGPLAVRLAKRQEARSAYESQLTSLSFAEHGDITQDGDVCAPRKLHKKSAASDSAMYSGVKYARSEDESSGSESGRLAKHLSLPILSPALSLPRGFSMGGSSSGGGPSENGRLRGERSDRNKTRSLPDGYVLGRRMFGSPEKQRGHAIHQQRRATSWIDEDALHGPRVSAKKRTKSKSTWFSGSGLTRTLSRHLSFRSYGVPELARSPTLPTEMEQGGGFVEETPGGPSESRRTGHVENGHASREFETAPQPPPHQQLHEDQTLASLGMAHIRVVDPGLPPFTFPRPPRHNNKAINATQRLAGQARVPSLDVEAMRQKRPRLRQSSTDAELEAILRRTAERLQDGNRSARRQTLMVAASLPSARVPGRAGPDASAERERHPGPTAPSPTKSAPAVMSCSELEGCNPRGSRQGPLPDSAPWRTHRRSHTREISRLSQVSQVSMLSEPDSLIATPSRRSAQADVLHTALSSPSRTAKNSPSYSHEEQISLSYSPASEISSALSTVYSVEEESPPVSVLNLDCTPARGSEPETRDDGWRGESDERLRVNCSPQSLHKRNGTLGQIILDGTPTDPASSSNRQHAMTPTYTRATTTPTPQNRQSTAEDPFTTRTSPTRRTPQRVSQIFSPLPAELPGRTPDPRARGTESHSGTPTPSPSRKRAIPPPERLQPSTDSPTPKTHHDLQFQVQPPSREPSPAPSEGGLSSVYESYWCRRYSESTEGSQALARLSSATMLAVPPAGVPHPDDGWDENASPVSTQACMNHGWAEGGGAGALPSGHVRFASGTKRYTHIAGPQGTAMVPNGAAKTGYAAAHSARPRPHSYRDISLGGVSAMSCESAYSQDDNDNNNDINRHNYNDDDDDIDDDEDEDDGEDRLAPLPLRTPTTASSSGRHGGAVRVTSTVAELRRMNSQVSCVSGHSAATTVIAASPTLPALRGGGCSPGKKGASSGARNYLALGTSSPGGSSSSSSRDGEQRGGDDDSGRDWRKRTTGPGETTTVDGARNGEGHSRRSRRYTVIESFEMDLDRARQVLRESRGYNLQPVLEPSKRLGTSGRVTEMAE
ncbi:hypothetical protein F4802DRAFT_433596 [Xylaria palmicola]|nr:hypothetical protein F4802DRAFT_433596 [Xylaria palmicola]